MWNGFRFAGIVLLTSGACFGQEGFNLAPGEKVVAIDGVPIEMSGNVPSPLSCSNGNCQVATNHVGLAQPTTSNSSNGSAIVGEGTVAYQHALREAQIIASRGGNYHRHTDGGHPLGNATGCRYSGTGYTWDVNRPGHCWEGELPESRLVARARAQGVNGAWFWSAHYR